MLGLAAAASSRARAAASVRLGVLQFGTVQWVADVIRYHGFDKAHGLALSTVTLANTNAGRVALMAGAADVVVSDWLFVAAQRTAGTALCFAPFSTATGGIMVRAGSSIHDLAGLKGRTLGVSGGPVDKSWLIVQAASRARGVDLVREARVVYGAPPLLGAKLRQGELDAVLTFWNFVAKLQSDGCREAVSVAECAHALGLPPRLSLVGFVFHQRWAEAHRAALEGFLAAAGAAERRLATSSDEWMRIRPLMNAPKDALFAALRRGFVAGIDLPSAPEEQAAAGRVFDILLRTGGQRATAGLRKLPSGIFWPDADASG